MNRANIKFLFLIFNIIVGLVYGLLPPSPGPISKEQFTDIPSAIIYGVSNENGLEPISNCNTIRKSVPQNFYPLLVLNSTAYFVRTPKENFQLAIVTNDGLFEMKIQQTLNAVSDYIESEISYDDSISTNGVFLYIDKFRNLIIYDINKDLNSIIPLNHFSLSINSSSSTYYDYSAKNYYVVHTFMDVGAKVQQFIIINILNQQSAIYTVNDFNLPYSMDTIYIEGYNNQVVLFGSNKSDQKSYLYLVDPTSSKYQLIAEKSYDTVMITGLNSRYLVFSYNQGTTTELLDLESITFSTYPNTCTETEYLNSFSTSIVPKQVFSQ